MPTRALAVRRPPLLTEASRWLPLAALAPGLLATVAIGAGCLWTHATISHDNRALAPLGVLCALAAIMQVRFAMNGWRQGRITSADHPLRQLAFWCALWLTIVALYAAALVMGPRDHQGWVFAAMICVAYTLLLLPLAVPVNVLETWRQWSQARRPRRTLLAAACLTLVIAMVEGTLELKECVRSTSGRDASALDTRQIAAANDSIVSARAGVFRLAILGDQRVLDEARHRGYLAHVERMVPGLAVVPVATAGPWSSHGRGNWSSRLAEVEADAAIAIVTVCSDLAPAETKSSWFDWRQLEIARHCGALPTAAANASNPPSMLRSNDGDGDESSAGPRLLACRTPIDEEMRDVWQRTFGALDEVVASCQERRMPLAMVVVPSKFQLNRPLCDVLVRRAGLTSGEIDLELPQRRLAGYADTRQLPLLDLLPHLRLCRQTLYQHNALQWNENGHTAAASAIGLWLQSRYAQQLAVAAQLSGAP